MRPAATTADKSRLQRLLCPSSIAVLGGKWAENVVMSCGEIGFKGDVWAVHPHKKNLGGVKAYADLDALPAAPDAVFLGVNRHASIDLVAALSAMGAGGVVAFASGFAEVEDGDAYQQQLVAAAGDMPILGPNCYGFINYLDGALLWPDVHGGKAVARGVAIITQSSNLAITLTMQQGGLPIAYMLTLGNQAMIGMAELIESLAADDRVSAIGLHIEGINDADAFAEAVRAAQRQGKNLLALKAGLSAAAADMTISHTASLSGDMAAARAFFTALGVGVVESIEALMGGLALLHCYGGCYGGVDDASLLTMSCSGGEAALIADAAMRGGVVMPPLSVEAAARIRATVNPLVSVSNPFDYHTFDWGDGARLEASFAAAMSAKMGLTALIIDFPRLELGRAAAWQVALESLVAAQQKTGAKTMVVASHIDGMPEAWAAWLMARGIPTLRGFDAAIASIKAAYQASLTPVSAPVSAPMTMPPRSQNSVSFRGLLDEWQAKQVLAAAGVAIPKSVLVETSAQINDVPLGGALAGRLVMKAVAPELNHKTESGAVRLGVQGAAEMAAAYDALAPISARVLVEDMISDYVAEILVGVARDAVVGLYLVVGAGGVMAELWQDTATLILPSPPDAIRHALMNLKIGGVLAGWRGQPRGDMEALVAAVLAVQDFALAHATTLEELEINPLMVRPHGQGAVAVDALMRFRQ